ncbi:hypothetical protein BCT23_06170 [Enterovibrio norvegicus]|uniref:Uncharacterized protein n=1 Tax=Enterovibrio norvegicus TaxID=188144 RepID=A0A2N7L610_9GAMM|nr:hypothetical protein BCT23_06170 [Enterovibrio norvegicus]
MRFVPWYVWRPAKTSAETASKRWLCAVDHHENERYCPDYRNVDRQICLNASKSVIFALISSVRQNGRPFIQTQTRKVYAYIKMQFFMQECSRSTRDYFQ